jgi:hypothetical protein
MDIESLKSLGLQIDDSSGVVEATLELDRHAFNPLTRKRLDKITFSVMGDRLIYLSPVELVGAHPIHLALIKEGNLEDLVVETLNQHLYQLERRSTELSTLGVSTKVEPESLQLSADLSKGSLKVTIAASRSGQFRVARAVNDGREVGKATGTVFELSEFRSKEALEEFVFSMFASDVKSSSSSTESLKAIVETNIAFAELALAFGDAQLPARTPIEVVVDLTVHGEKFRFAAARVSGREFRGLLAGPKGKVWSGRFNLSEFVGVKQLAANQLKVTDSEVEIVA